MCPGCNQGVRCSPGTGQGTHCQHGSWCLLHKTCQAQAPFFVPKGTVTSLSPSITPRAASIKESTAHSTQVKRARKRKGSFSHLSTTSALHRVKAP